MSNEKGKSWSGWAWVPVFLAVADASAAPGLLVGGVADIPVGGRAGRFGLALLVAAGAFVLLRQFR